MARCGGPVRVVANVGAKSDEECAGRAERRGRVWDDGARLAGASKGMSPDRERLISEKARGGGGG